MKVLVLQGSPRRGGNTEQVVEMVMGPVSAAGHEVEVVRLAGLSIGGCRGCVACQKVPDEPGCAVKDDMIGLHAKMLAADLAVFAVPVFCWGWPAQAKAALDRLYCMHKFGESPYKVLIEGKMLALVVTAGGDEYDGAEICVATFRSFAESARTRVAGRLVVCEVNDPADVPANPEIRRRAERFGERLAKALAGS